MGTANGSNHIGPIRARRREAGLSQEELAIASRCSVNYVRVLERGYRPQWNASPKFRRVAKLLGLSEADLQGAETNGTA